MAPDWLRPPDYQRVIDWTDDYIVERSARVVAIFVVLTLVFTAGLGNVQTSAGTEDFTQDVPAQDAFEDINREFTPSFSVDTGGTTLIQRSDNVLSKQSLLHMLEAQHRVQQHDGLRVASTASAASIVAQTLDPSAQTLEAQIDAVEHATPGQIDAAVKRAAEAPRFTGLLSNDFNRREASASATIATVQHEIPAGISSSAGVGGASPLTSIQLQTEYVVESAGGDIQVFGNGIVSQEFSSVIVDTLLITVPAAVILIVVFLAFGYRDLVDLLLGVVSLGMALVWTFGFMGLADIPFNQMLIAVPPLLLAVGIDYGIHAINRYREEREEGLGIHEGMRRTTDQLLVAFFIVTTTTVIGFLSNVTSSLAPIRDFGVVASIGIVFTFLIFGVFVPATKVLIDDAREKYPIPVFSQTALGAEGTYLGEALSTGVTIAKYVPTLFLLAVVLLSATSAWYATGVSTSFTQEDFLPPEETPDYLKQLPEPFRPDEYTVVATINFLEDNFESATRDSVTIYVEGPMEQDHALEQIRKASDDPPDTFLRANGRAEPQSIISVIESQAARDPEFRQLVNRNDRNGNGVPDDNLGQIYDYLLSSPARAEALSYLTENRRSTQVVYSVEADASQAAVTADAKTMADRYRYDGTATGSTVVFEEISALILESAVRSLTIAILGAIAFLFFIYWVFTGRPSLGVVNTVPILVSVALIAGSMRVLGISFNAFTGTVLAITIGLGIDYSVHITHRFADEYERHEFMPALRRTVTGTGGALAGSMLTTVSGIGVLTLAIFPAIGQFGLLTALSVLYSFLASIFVLPPTLAVWDKLLNRGRWLGALWPVSPEVAGGGDD